MVASMGGGRNLVDVADGARAHVAALDRGRERERYLVGGANLSLDQVWTMLAEITGRRAPTRHIPYGLALAMGHADALRSRLTGGQPMVPLEGVRMAQYAMHINDARARAEIGHAPSPVAAALERSVAWFRDHGYA
jgi:dihydroflavonol-4-reductase